MKSLRKPVFILGIGAQKAGTTWLHSQISKNEHFNMGFTKEYHIWDAIFLDLCKDFRGPYQGQADHVNNELRMRMQTVEDVYENYFLQLISDKIRVVGDMTPSYAFLSIEAFETIKFRLESVGFEVKVVFLMRDPVQRNWSAIRMKQRNSLHRGLEISDEQLIIDFKEFYQNPQNFNRTDYRSTILNITKIFKSENIYVGFYETLFREHTLATLSSFLGLNLSHANFNEKINTSRYVDLPYQIKMDCRHYYDDVYSFCHNEFPLTKFIWN